MRSQQLGVVVCVGRTAAAQDNQIFAAVVLHAVRSTGRNRNRIAWQDLEALFTQCHHAAAGGDVIQLFAAQVPVQCGRCAGATRASARL